MRIYLVLSLLALSILMFSSCSEEDLPAGAQTYTVTFTSNWNAANHPTDYPSNAHFSKATGFAHNANASLFAAGSTASAGIKEMAETGGTSPLDDELQVVVDAGNAMSVKIGANISQGSTSNTFEITVSPDFPMVSLVSMIAPSPDWFVAVQNVLLYENGAFKDNVTVNAESYDAGTDSGTSFASADAETNPAENISVITTAPLGDGTNVTPHVASFTFVKKQ